MPRAKTNTAKYKRIIKERSRLERILLAALILILLLILWGSFSNWWRWTYSDDLGTAFYPSRKPLDSQLTPGLYETGNSGGSEGGGGNSIAGGTSGSGNSSSNPPARGSKSPILTFAAGVDQGDTKQEVSGEAQDLDEDCTVLANGSQIGKQEVCVYTDGDRLVTVTYLNDRVISASRAGF